MNASVRKILLILPYFITYSLNAQYWEWAKSLGDITGNTVIQTITSDSNQNLFATGYFSCKTLTIGESTLTNKGQHDILVVKMNALGNVLIAKNFGGANNEAATAIALDQSGNIYLAGNFSSLSLTFGTNTLVNKGDQDGFVVKLSPALEVEWALQVGGSAKDHITGLAVDEENYLIVSGYSEPGFNPGTVFLMKIRPDKTIAWTREGVGEWYYSSLNAVTTDKQGEIFSCGRFTGKLTFDGVHEIESSSTGEPPHQYHEENAYLLNYDKDGKFIHAVAISEMSRGTSILHANNGIYLSGDKIHYGIGWGWPLASSRVYLALYSDSLELEWVVAHGRIDEFQSLDLPSGLSSDEQGNIYQVGTFFGPGIPFGPDSIENIFHEHYYYQQVFVFKYSATGQALWAKSLGGKLCDTGTGIHVLSEDKFYLTGTHESSPMVIPPWTLTNNAPLESLYVHQRPRRDSRYAKSFITRFGDKPNTIETPVARNNVHLYPNPSSDREVYIRLENQNHTGGFVEVFNLNGLLIQKQAIHPGEQNVALNVHTLTKGIYLVKIQLDNEIHALKMARD